MRRLNFLEDEPWDEERGVLLLDELPAFSRSALES
jgi:hypothetical protein